MTVTDFAYSASHRVMAGLRQEVGIIAGRHYHPTGNNSARVVVLRLSSINPHYLPAIRGMQKQLTMWAGLDDKHAVRIGHGHGAVYIEIPKPPPYWKQVTIESMEARRMIRRGLVATLGMGLQDEPKRIDFKEASMAHVFITGQTRSGKTNAQRLIAWNIAHNTSPNEAQMIIFDVAKRGYKWRDFGGVAHLAHPVVTEVEEADGVLAWLNREIERRATTGQTEPRLFILIDELKALADDSDVASRYLSRIASVGGEFGIHLILATQYPQIKMLGSAELKRNVTTRLCGKVDDAQAATNALGMTDTGAESLQGYGDFLLKDLNDISRMTVAKIEPSHVAGLDRGNANRIDYDGLEVGDAPEVARDLDAEAWEPGPLAMAIFDPSGVNSFARRVKEAGLIDRFGNDRAARYLEFGKLVREAARQMGQNCLPDHPG
jgi:S-DNA-T family DNA segregation ATPase FtsK/SpoIIIE